VPRAERARVFRDQGQWWCGATPCRHGYSPRIRARFLFGAKFKLQSYAPESIALLVQADNSSTPPFGWENPLDIFFEGTFVVAILDVDLSVENIVPLDVKPVLVLWLREGIRAPFTDRGDIVSPVKLVPPSKVAVPVKVVVAG
jgi:hypothetical protein